ncbi:MAG: ribbon-helix-helix domain-containing protein [Alphaproteobacteria bacterium]
MICRNVWIGSRRTSIRLEPAFWDLLERTAAREDMSIHDICTRVSDRAEGYGLTGSIRVFLVCYAWTARMGESLESVPAGRLPQPRTAAPQRGPM